MADDLTEKSIEALAAAIRIDRIGIKPTKLVLAPPFNTPEGKKVALRLIIERLEALGEDASTYRQELASS